MNKVTTAALAGLLVVAAGAQASASRWAGFGAASAYIADVQDIFSLPGVVASHADTTYLEMGSTTGKVNGGGPTGVTLPAMTTLDISVPNNAWGGVHGKLAGGVLGIWFNRADTSLGNINQTLISIPNPGTTVSTTSFNALTTQASSMHNQFEVIYGYPLSDATTLGIGISRATNSYKSESATTGATVTSNEAGASDFGLSLGVEQKEVGPISLLEIGLQYNSAGLVAADKGANTNKITGSGTGINLRVGGDLAGENGMFGRLELGFSSQSLNFKDEFATAPASTVFQESKSSATGWNLGYAMGGTNDKGMGLMGFMLSGLSQSNDEAGNINAVDKADISTMRLLATTAGEAKINNWLAFRAGLESDLFYSMTSTTDQGTTSGTTKKTTTVDAHSGTVNDPNAKISMGTTLTLGNIIIDGVLNQGLMYSGTFLVSGIPQALSTQVSLTWPWGGSKQ